jgi:hypothetical protein
VNGQGSKIVANLISPTYFATTDKGADCFTFYYYMASSDNNVLNLLLMQRKMYDSTIWTQRSNFGDVWRRAQATVQAEFDFELVIQGLIFY